jgi:hypothetical protein
MDKLKLPFESDYCKTGPSPNISQRRRLQKFSTRSLYGGQHQTLTLSQFEEAVEMS